MQQLFAKMDLDGGKWLLFHEFCIGMASLHLDDDFVDQDGDKQMIADMGQEMSKEKTYKVKTTKPKEFTAPQKKRV